nr:hypothetical protein [Gammaproteobacteria bacterium]
DNQTMIDVYNESKEIYSDVLVYGEPWTGGTTQLVDGNEANKLTSQKTVQSSLSQSYFAGSNVLVGAFNDIIRNAVRGDNGPGEGWVQGTSAMVTNIINTMKGVFSSEKVNPGQVLNYVSCHDNYTLYDQLIQTQGTRVLENMYTQAEAIILTSQGVAFMQEGEDFMRSKNYTKDGKTLYEGNSYNVGDYINDMDYELKADNIEMFEHFKELIALRKNIDLFTLSTRDEINNSLKNVSADNNKIQFNLTNGSETYLIIHNLNKQSVTLDGNYDIIYSNIEVENTSGISSISLSDNQTVVLKKK